MWMIRSIEDTKKPSTKGLAEMIVSRRKDRNEGTYVLIIKLAKTQKIKPGNLPEARYEKGIYLYIGRARTGLRARIDRHLCSHKKIFWHVDYLLQKAKIEDVWVRPRYFGECLTTDGLPALRIQLGFERLKIDGIRR